MRISFPFLSLHSLLLHVFERGDIPFPLLFFFRLPWRCVVINYCSPLCLDALKKNFSHCQARSLSLLHMKETRCWLKWNSTVCPPNHLLKVTVQLGFLFSISPLATLMLLVSQSFVSIVNSESDRVHCYKPFSVTHCRLEMMSNVEKKDAGKR